MDADRKLAKLIWRKIEYSLSDRGCFNGIDDDIMEELRRDMLGMIEETIKLAKP